MKKIILSAVAIMAFGFANAQEGQFKIGANVGMPLGDVKESTLVNFGFDAAYLWEVADKFKAGITTGYNAYVGKTETIDLGGGNTYEIKGETTAFIPLAATAQYSLTDNLFVGADLGYAIYASSGEGKGGILYEPKFGFQTEKIELYAGYKAISADGASITSINLGFNYKF